MARGGNFGGQLTTFFSMGGGLDLVSPAIAVEPGKVIAAVNYEPAASGYRRILGFERYDGHPRPSEATWHMIRLENVSGTIALGNTVTGATSGATGKALAATTLLSTELGLGAVVGTFVDGENLQVAGVTKAQANGAAVETLSPDSATAALWQAQAIADARALISAVPGSGPVRGIWTFDDNQYAFRDNVGATAGIMHKSTTAGWVAVAHARTLSFTSGGTFEILEGATITGATSGATGIVRRIVVTSGTWGAGTAAGRMVLDTQSGTFQAEDLNVGANLNVATIAGNSAAHAFPAGGRYEFVNHNFYASASMRRMYGVNGVGPAFEFDGTVIAPIITGTVGETPHRIAVHRMHLFLAFPGGNVVFSRPGEPHDYDAALGAGTFGIGAEITDFISNTATVLTILADTGVFNLYGNDESDFQVETLSDEAGALPWTAEKVGVAIYMDNRGVRSMTSTQAYGNFALGTLTPLVQPLLANYRKLAVQPVASCRIRAKDQYRVFFENNQGLTVYLGKKRPEILPFDLGKLVTCIASTESEDLQEEVYFGSDDGFVYQLEKGNSFDGEPIPHFLRIPFGHQGTPQHRKRYHKAIIECEAAPNTELRVSSDFNYGDANVVSAPSQEFTIAGGGGTWDVSNWDQFYWSAPLAGLAEAYLNGVGRNMSLLIAGAAADQDPHLIQGATIFYSMRGLTR